jgi:hypothetical protein
MFSVLSVRVVQTAANTARGNLLLCQTSRCRSYTSFVAARSFMSTQALASPDEDAQMMLILGKPGGGKGTISGKMLKVCLYVCVNISFSRIYPLGSLFDDPIHLISLH